MIIWELTVTVFWCHTESSASDVAHILEKVYFGSGPVLTASPTAFKLLSSQLQSCQPADLCSSPVDNREKHSNVASKLLKGAMQHG